MCLFSLDFYALSYSGLDSAYMKCVKREDKKTHALTFCVRIVVLSVIIQKSNPGNRLLEDTPVIKEHAKTDVS